MITELFTVNSQNFWSKGKIQRSKEEKNVTPLIEKKGGGLEKL